MRKVLQWISLPLWQHRPLNCCFYFHRQKIVYTKWPFREEKETNDRLNLTRTFFENMKLIFFHFVQNRFTFRFPHTILLFVFEKKKTWPISKSCLFCVEIHFLFWIPIFSIVFFLFSVLPKQNFSLFKIFLDFLDKTNGIMKWYECVGNDFGVFRVRPQCSSQ
jgi:hypothetical protein